MRRLLWVAVACGAVAGCVPAGPPPGTGAKVAAEPATGYDAIREGMTRAEVERIMGGPGEEHSKVVMGGHEMVVVTWKEQTGAYTDVTFRGGFVSLKSRGGPR